jgi:WD40 repeat protein
LTIRHLAGAYAVLLATLVPHSIHAQKEITSQPGAVFDSSAYLHYLLALRFATDGIPHAALHEAAASLRIQAGNNPAASLAFQLIAEQRQNVHIRLCCFNAKVLAARYSPDGTRVMTVLDDRTIRIWDAETGRQMFASMQHDGDILAAEWSADSRRIVSSSRDAKLHLWDSATGKPVRQPFTLEKPLAHIALSPDGDSILGSYKGAVYLFHVVSGETISPKPAYHDDVNVVTFSNDGKYALIATNDDVADIVDAATAKRLHRLPLGNAAFSAVFSSDSRYAMTASEDRTAHIWDVNTGVAQGKGFEQSGAISDAVFSQDGAMVLTTSYDHTARVWSARTGEAKTPLLQHSASVVNGGFSADGTLVFTRARDLTIRVWNVATGEAAMVPVRDIGDYNDVMFSPRDPKLLLAIGNTVEIMDVAPGEDPPQWLADLADFEASRSRFDQTAATDSRTSIEALRQNLLNSKSTSRWTQFGKWYFATPGDRTISPWSRVPLQEYFQNILRLNSPESRAYAKQIGAGHPAWLLQIKEREQ